MLPFDKLMGDFYNNLEAYVKKMQENDDYDADKSIIVKMFNDYIKVLDVDYPIMSSPNFTKAEKEIINDYIVSRLNHTKVHALLYEAAGKKDKDKFAEYEKKANEIRQKTNESMEKMVILGKSLYNIK